MNLELNKHNPEELRLLAFRFEELRDYNSSIKCLYQAAMAGSAMAYIDITYYIKYPVDGYEYTEEALDIVDPSKFGLYLDLAIKLDSVDAMFYKAREQFIGDGFIPYDLNSALEIFKYLNTLGYDPYDTFDDDWTVEDYIEEVAKLIDESKAK